MEINTINIYRYITTLEYWVMDITILGNARITKMTYYLVRYFITDKGIPV
jgi:hypothetical protein